MIHSEPLKIQRNMCGGPVTDPLALKYRRLRMSHWDRVAPKKKEARRAGTFYHRMLRHYYGYIISPGQRVLELGCAHGELLASVEPSFGVGIDFSSRMLSYAKTRFPQLEFLQGDVHEVELDGKFDFVVLSDIVNDLWDVQRVFERIRPLCHSRSRLVLNFFNNLWRIPLGIAKKLGLGAELLEQNWFSHNDIFNLLNLSGFEVIHSRSSILLPADLRYVSTLANRFLVNFWPFRWFALTNFVVARPAPTDESGVHTLPSVSVVVPARNESGNIDQILQRMPDLGRKTEIVFVEGNSTDGTYEAIECAIRRFPSKSCRLLRQPGAGKGDAVRKGFGEAEGDVLMILDADLTVPPEDLPRFLDVLASGKAEFVNGVRLVYPLEDQSMQFFNILGNKFFSAVFSWLLGQPVKDTLCGTKVLWRGDYDRIAENRFYFGDFDPFGDFDLLFGAAKMNLKIAEMPIRYRSRTYGETNIDRWRHGWLLLRMVFFAAKRIKFV